MGDVEPLSEEEIRLLRALAADELVKPPPSPFDWLIPFLRTLATLDAERARREAAEEALTRANSVLRSAHAIASRERDRQDRTNWDGFLRRLEHVLHEQHALMYPPLAHPEPVAGEG